MESQLFPALLRYWRTRRGLSQLELALEAGVSAKHVSFLESSRAKPSAEMVLRLCTTLAVPLRDQNQALVAAGFGPRFPASPADALTPELDEIVTQMMDQHEPFPLTVLSIDGSILRANRGAEALFGEFIGSPTRASGATLDIYTLLLDPRFMRPFIVEWETFARNLVARLHREQLARGDARLSALLDRIFALPGVLAAWRQPDFSSALPPTLRFALARGDVRASFLVAVTTFSTAQQLPLDELRIESCFPLDEATRDLCRRLVDR